MRNNNFRPKERTTSSRRTTFDRSIFFSRIRKSSSPFLSSMQDFGRECLSSNSTIHSMILYVTDWIRRMGTSILEAWMSCTMVRPLEIIWMLA